MGIFKKIIFMNIYLVIVVYNYLSDS